MRMLRMPGLFLLLVLTVCSMHGQALTPGEVVHLDIKGLPVAGIRALAKDNDGALWIGTENGLCRYDGLNVDVYRNIPGDSTSIPGNYVQDLVLDGEGRMWASCFGGVCVFDPHLTWRTRGPVFERKPLLTRNERFAIYEATDLFIDHEGGIWLSCVINGLAKYDATTGIFREVLELRAAMPPGANNANVLGMTCDAAGMVWVVSRMSLYRFDPKAGSAQRYDLALPGDLERQGALLARITQDANDPNTLWLGAWGLGLVRFDKRTGSFENYTISQGGPVNLTNIVWSVLPQRDGRILVGIDKGLHWFDPRSRRFTKTFGTFAWKSGVFEASANTLMQEADGRVWIGSYDGLHILPARSNEYDQWNTRAHNLCAALDHSGYWAASMYTHRQLFKLGPSGEVLDSLAIPLADEERAEPISILQTKDGRVLIGTTRGLVIFDPKARSFAIPANWSASMAMVQDSAANASATGMPMLSSTRA